MNRNPWELTKDEFESFTYAQVEGIDVFGKRTRKYVYKIHKMTGFFYEDEIAYLKNQPLDQQTWVGRGMAARYSLGDICFYYDRNIKDRDEARLKLFKDIRQEGNCVSNEAMDDARQRVNPKLLADQRVAENCLVFSDSARGHWLGHTVDPAQDKGGFRSKRHDRPNLLTGLWTYKWLEDERKYWEQELASTS